VEARVPVTVDTFPHRWQAEILQAPPLIAPARQYVYPRAVEEVERGALQLLLRSRPGAPPVLLTCALGFADPSLPHGLWSCPDPDQLCAVAGGYAYIVQASEPGRWTQIPYRPVTSIHAAPDANLLIFSSFHRLWALSKSGHAWETAKLSWEGLRVTEISGTKLEGFGWHIETDTEVPFAVDLTTGKHTGGIDPPPSQMP
jgi:hypothetical protein